MLCTREQGQRTSKHQDGEGDEAVVVEEFTGRLALWAEVHDHGCAAALRRLPAWLKLPPEEAVIPIARIGMDPAMRQRGVGITPFVVASVLWSLYAFLRSPDDYWETICTAIEVGGDVDTTAAMAGALSGARLGMEALPGDLAAAVGDRGTWNLQPLVGLARECYAQTERERGGSIAGWDMTRCDRRE